MSKTRTSILVAIVSVLVVSGLAGATVAHAEEPFWRVKGTRLAKGQEKEYSLTGLESYVISGQIKGKEFVITCTEATVESGAHILGSEPEEPADDHKQTAVFRCTITKFNPFCWVVGEEIILNLALGHLVTWTDATGTHTGVRYEPTTSTVMFKIHFEGPGCEGVESVAVEGTYAGGFAVGGKTVEVGSEVETTSLELFYPKEQIKKVKLKGVSTATGLTIEGKEVKIEGRSAMKLFSGEKFAAWTK